MTSNCPLPSRRRRPGLLLVTGVLVAITACRQSPDALKRKYVANADAYAAQGKYAEAIVEYRNAIQADGRAGDVHAKLGEAYLRIGDGGNALKEYVRAADLQPDDAEAQVRAAHLLLLAGQFDDAKAHAEKVLARDPKNVRAALIVANSLAGLKDVDGAIAQIEDASRLNPGQSGIYTNLGALEQTRGRNDAALQAFTKAVEIDPTSASPRLALGMFYWTIAKWPEAEEALKKAVSLDPANAIAQRALANFYVSTHRPALAEEPLKRMVELTKTPQTALTLADYYTEVGNAAAARATLEPLTSQPVSRIQASIRLATLDYQAGNHAAAYERLSAILATDKSNLQALLVKGNLLLAEGKTDEALAVANTLVDSHPTATAGRFLLGQVQVARRQPDEAVAAFEEVLRLNPRATAAKLALAKLHLAQHRPDASVGYAQEALNADPGNAEARLVLVRGLLTRGDVGGAEQELNRLMSKYPKSAAVQTQMGLVRGRKGDLAGARQNFQEALRLDPSSLDALGGLITLDLTSRDFSHAKSLIDARLAEATPSAALLVLAARTYLAANDVARSEQLLRQAIERDPNYLTAYGALGQVYLRQNKLDAARAEFDAIAQRDPKSVGALTMAGVTLQALGNNGEAIKRYERALQIDPHAAVAANNLAWLHAESGQQLDAALQLAQRAKERLPESAEVNDTLGFVYYRKNMAALAVSTLKASVAKDPANAIYEYHLGLAYAQAGDKASARRSLTRALQLKTDFAGAKEARDLLNSLGS
jgi:tetratricopeptide (TPR) repeat protein